MLRDRDTWVSGYKFLWMLVMFDLPVVEREERRAATRFRNYLLDEGFQMGQYSVYLRLLDGRDSAEALMRRIEANVLTRGSIHILTITDKQYENIRTFQGKRRDSPKKPDQLQLF